MSKEYPILLKKRFAWIARRRFTRTSKAIGPARLAKSFGSVVMCIEMGFDEDQAVIAAFRKAKLSYEDPFHWWELLHAFCSVHSKRPKKRLWTEAKKRRLVRDAVAAGKNGMSILKICEEMKRRNPKEWRQNVENLQAQIARFGLTQEIRLKIRAKR